MKLKAWLFPLGARSKAWIEKLLPESASAVKNGRCPVSVSDPVLPRILSGDGDGYLVNGEAVFSPAERASVRHFEASCRRVIPEARRDHAANLATVESTATRGGEGLAGIRLVTGFVLHQVRIQSDVVAGIGGWTSECVIGSDVTKAFESGGLSGFQLVPVVNPKTGSPHSSCAQLFSESVLPPALIDASVERIRSRLKEEDGALRHLGCLSYAEGDLAGYPDFNRSAEPWAGWWGFPSWVVSARVATLFRRARLKGWHFRPVLERGTAVHDQYLAGWDKLAALVARGVRTNFHGGRF